MAEASVVKGLTFEGVIVNPKLYVQLEHGVDATERILNV